MTIEVTIHNKDKGKTVEIFAQEYDKGRLAKTEIKLGEIRPEGSYTMHLHLLRDLVLREIHPDYK